jgi:PAS domain S-box-containing protein
MSGTSSRSFDAESLLRSLMENVPGAIYRAANDSVWTVQRVSEDIESITGYPAADWVDASKITMEKVTHADDREPVEQELRAAIAAGRPYALEFRIVHADGGIRWVLERGVKTIDRDGVEWLDGIIFDITERRAAEELRVERELEALRVAELEASRARIVAAADAARHRIERDLHDGAQQRLLVASLHLLAAQRAMEKNGDAAPLLQAARTELDAGMAELRELARGIHPTLLTMRGLSAAVEALTHRSTVPVVLHDTLGQRLEPAVETALYYTVAEALTNVDRYAGATQAGVRLRLDGDAVEVEVVDDGCGGVDPARGSGLRGLEDRLGTVGGVLEVTSPPGHGTRLRARVPIRRDYAPAA